MPGILPQDRAIELRREIGLPGELQPHGAGARRVERHVAPGAGLRINEELRWLRAHKEGLMRGCRA
jgi:hypothetical protein